MEEENKTTGVEDTTVENTGTDNVTEQKETQKSLLELINSDKELQSQFDKLKAESMQTAVKNAKAKWEEDSKNKQIEAERLAKMNEDQKKDYALEQETIRANKAESELNAYKLKDEAIRQASKRGISIEYLDTIDDFSKETADSILKKLDIFEKISKADKEKAIAEYSKEPPPQTGDRNIKTKKSGFEKFMENYKK